MPTGNRNTTVVAPQALLLMNSDLVIDSADALALLLINQPGDDAAKVQSAYQRLGRPATDAETQRVFAFIKELQSEAPAVEDVAVAGNPENPTDAAATSASRQAWSIFCQSLFASNEFFYVR